MKRKHYYCEDGWYSCPKAEDGCYDEWAGTDCNCGADEFNAEIDSAINAGRGMRMSKTPRTDEHCRKISDDALGLEYVANELQYWAEKLEEELAATQNEIKKLTAAPLCAGHAEQWYCERNLIATESGCFVCDLEAQRDKLAEAVKVIRGCLVDGAVTLTEKKTASEIAIQIDGLLKECGK